MKVACLRMLANLNLTPWRAALIGQFIDLYLPLAPAEEQTFEAAIEALLPKERKRAMAHITSWERRGMEKGLKKGVRKGREQGMEKSADIFRSALIVALRDRLGPLSAAIRSELQTLTHSKLVELTKYQGRLQTRQDLEEWLEKHRG